MNAQIDYVEYLVIGTGINVNTQEFPDEIKEVATSAAVQLGHIVSRAELAAAVIRCFEKNYEIYLESCSLKGLLEDYREKMINVDREVKVMGPGEVFEGVAKGINPAGELLVERPNGSVTAVSGGEVSVREFTDTYKTEGGIGVGSEDVVLCGASAYEQKYYFNEDFQSLPEDIKNELHILCVLYTEDIGGILLLTFDENGALNFKVESAKGDAMFDEIGSALKIKEIQRTKQELLESLETYYRVFFLGEDWDDSHGTADR